MPGPPYSQNGGVVCEYESTSESGGKIDRAAAGLPGSSHENAGREPRGCREAAMKIPVGNPVVAGIHKGARSSPCRCRLRALTGAGRQP